MLNEERPRRALRGEGPAPPYRLKLLRCRRTGRWIGAAEHCRCPYCFGDEAELERGRYERFCDFHPGQDPVCFGLPTRLQRFWWG